MDTNTNFQAFNGDLSPYLNKSFNYNDLVGLNHQMGASDGNQPTFVNGGNIYQVKSNGNNTFGLQQIDSVANRQQTAAQQQYQQAQQAAIGGLKSQQGSLAGQYADLLKTVNEQYSPLVNQTTANTNAEMARRGLTPDSLLAQQQVQGALQPVYGAEAANAQALGQGSIADTNALAQTIAQAQLGGAQFDAQLPLQYGSLSLSQAANPAQIALAQAQAKQANTQASYIPTSIGGMMFNTNNNSYSNPAMSLLAQMGYKLTP